MTPTTLIRTCRPRAVLVAICAAAALYLAGCATQAPKPEPRPPMQVRSQLVLLMPDHVDARNAWARDIQTAFRALGLEADKSHLCAALAVIAQESSFRAEPVIPGLADIAREEIRRRARAHHIPDFMVEAALQIQSPNGQSYGERLDDVRTERQLSAIFEDLIASVPLGELLFADANPVDTGGPMQVSIAFAREYADQHGYPYPVTESIRDEVFSRRGGLYFGIAHLLAYPVSYHYMRYRFADFNAGHYASRNAAFQQAVSRLSGRELALDGDMRNYGDHAGATESALRSLKSRLGLDADAIDDALELGHSHEFEQTELYQRLFTLADADNGSPLPRAILPRIRLHSPKISSQLTTAWFARRVDDRYRRCLRRR